MPSTLNDTGILFIACKLNTIHDLRFMKDGRYDKVRNMLQIGAIRKFSDIFTWIPKTVIRLHLRTSGQRMDKMVENPAEFTLEEIYQIAELIGYDPKKLLMMAAEEMDAIAKENPGANH